MLYLSEYMPTDSERLVADTEEGSLSAFFRFAASMESRQRLWLALVDSSLQRLMAAGRHPLTALLHDCCQRLLAQHNFEKALASVGSALKGPSVPQRRSATAANIAEGISEILTAATESVLECCASLSPADTFQTRRSAFCCIANSLDAHLVSSVSLSSTTSDGAYYRQALSSVSFVG